MARRPLFQGHLLQSVINLISESMTRRPGDPFQVKWGTWATNPTSRLRNKALHVAEQGSYSFFFLFER